VRHVDTVLHAPCTHAAMFADQSAVHRDAALIATTPHFPRLAVRVWAALRQMRPTICRAAIQADLVSVYTSTFTSAGPINPYPYHTVCMVFHPSIACLA